MRTTNEIFIPIPKPKTIKASVTIDGTDVTPKVMESTFTQQLINLGVGGFNIKLVNTSGEFSEAYTGGEEVIFKADYTDGSTTQFKGRIDYPRDTISKEGHFLEIAGRHKSYFVNERKICYSAQDEDFVDTIKNICSEQVPELDTSSLPASTGITVSVEWDYKEFPQCMGELMDKTGYDIYIDDDLKIIILERNSTTNEQDAIAEYDNFIKTNEVGTDDYYEKTRVTVMGEDDQGLPIIYTAISGKDDSNISREADKGVREVFYKATNVNTFEKVKELARAILSKYTNRPKQGYFESLGLETIKPGDNIWIVVPRQKIYGQYRIIKYTHKFGMKVGGWKTEVITENQINTQEEIMSSIIETQQTTTKSKNPNKLLYSYNLTFDDDTNTQSHSNTIVANGVLKISSDSSDEGTFISKQHEAIDNITKMQLQVKGKDYTASEFWVSLDGTNYEQITTGQLFTPSIVGKKLSIKIRLLRTYYNPSPEIDGIVLLYK